VFALRTFLAPPFYSGLTAYPTVPQTTAEHTFVFRQWHCAGCTHILPNFDFNYVNYVSFSKVGVTAFLERVSYHTQATALVFASSGYCMYRQLTPNNYMFYTQTVFVCFVWI